MCDISINFIERVCLKMRSGIWTKIKSNVVIMYITWLNGNASEVEDTWRDMHDLNTPMQGLFGQRKLKASGDNPMYYGKACKACLYHTQLSFYSFSLLFICPTDNPSSISKACLSILSSLSLYKKEFYIYHLHLVGWQT